VLSEIMKAENPTDAVIQSFFDKHGFVNPENQKQVVKIGGQQFTFEEMVEQFSNLSILYSGSLNNILAHKQQQIRSAIQEDIQRKQAEAAKAVEEKGTGKTEGDESIADKGAKKLMNVVEFDELIKVIS